jgi:hypothetical protein
MVNTVLPAGKSPSVMVPAFAFTRLSVDVK